MVNAKRLRRQLRGDPGHFGWSAGRQVLLWLVQADRKCTMSAVAFDSLEYAHQLEATGMPREQAEVVAKGLTTMFIHNFESLVTRD